ncbi:hypothetical protein [Sulfurimonas sp.]|uniref:hypothetical protein n=1 Tax=Sulfurimonas sp. TaxID=2022749 RepID=UPI0025DF7EEF|nr:hypothetical protein [Sulfurimonas sp.]MBW6487538.1 hypothetical protein [Sulfurimonas sp.]
MHGDLDDDLIVIKATPQDVQIKDIFQMHNPSNKFQYSGRFYNSIHIPGFIDFKKHYNITDNEIYLVMLANEREEAHSSKRIRTHYKSESLYFNNQLFLPALMPEYNSVPNYPLWFAEDEIPMVQREDINGSLYNYYHLFDNSVVQAGLILPREGEATVRLYDNNDNILYTFKQFFKNNTPMRLKSNEELQGSLSSHSFVEVGNILNDTEGEEKENNNYIANITIDYKDRVYLVPLPYPMMYPNLIYGVAANA